MKKILLTLLLAATLFASDKTIIVAASPVPHAQILKAASSLLKNQGYTLVIKEFGDYVLPNMALDAGEVDANFFQHKPYLIEFNKNKGTKLISIASIHLEPMGLYSKLHKSLDFTKKKGLKVAIPNDPTNESRALEILARNKLLVLDEVPLKTTLDIIENPYEIEFIELKAAQLPRVLPEVDYALINANYALSAGLDPNKALIKEQKDSPFANIIAIRQGSQNEAKIKALKAAMQSKTVKDFIIQKYQGQIIPAF